MGRPGLTRHRKFARLSRLLGSEALARGHLELIWDTAYENGDELLGDAGDVEQLARWQDEPGVLANALAESGFLDRDGEMYRVHDLWDHAPEYVTTRRGKEAERRKPKVCAACGADYRSPDPRSRYCTAACRTAAYRDRVAERDGSLRHGDARETDGDGSPAPSSRSPLPLPRTEEAAGDLVAFRTRLAAALDVPSIALGKNPSRTVASFRRWLDLGLEDALLDECVRLAGEKGVTPSSLAWWPGWIDTVSDQKLERLAAQGSTGAA